MSSSASAQEAIAVEPTRTTGERASTDADAAPVVLRGTARGLVIQIVGEPSVEAIGASLTELLAEAPGFFAGNPVRVAVDGTLPAGALARLEEVTARFDLAIAEIGPQVARPVRAPAAIDGVPQPGLAEGSAPIGDAPADLDVDLDVDLDELEAALPPGPRLMLGPVRSGVVLEHPGHLVVLGDVNPGAEIRAEGNIVVLGRLRGIAHAGVGREGGFILALSLQPQQLRVGRLVARAGADDSPGEGPEIAYATGKTIVVERYQGKLPTGLAASM
jgi:septum site-determining protein MinC